MHSNQTRDGQFWDKVNNRQSRQPAAGWNIHLVNPAYIVLCFLFAVASLYLSFAVYCNFHRFIH
jgi:hypothetical protein